MKHFTIGCISLMVISFTFVCISYAGIDIETCVGMWLFDDEKVDTVKDFSGKGNDGIVTPSPPEWIDGRYGKAVEFTASSQSIDVPDADILNFDEESFSVVMWFNFSTAQDWNRIVRERNPGPWGAGNDGWELQTQGTQVHWSLDDKAGNHQRNTYDNAGDGEWHHTAMIVDRDEENLITYLDGENEKIIDIASIESVTGGLPIVIGGGVTGAVDEVGIFNVVLTMDDVVNIMNLGFTEVLSGAAVSPYAKLATIWGRVKAE